MAEVEGESLGGFVRRVMKQKNLKVRDVETRSGGTISNGYISDITSGNVTNLSIDKMRALARGLGVDPIHLFRIACGPADDASDESAPLIDSSSALVLLGLMEKISLSGRLQRLLVELSELSREEQEAVLDFVRQMVETRDKDTRERRPV